MHSLAKWKRHALARYGFAPGTGLYTDMDAIRKDEVVDELHSIYVDQWDWERILLPGERELGFLHRIVEHIYAALLATEQPLVQNFPVLRRRLPSSLTFVHSEDLEARYPTLSPRLREDAMTREHGAVFLIGIGHALRSGAPHDLRAADYDDWWTETKPGYHGLNGDLLVHDDLRDKALELSSMGIRVDATALEAQLTLMGLTARRAWPFHQGVLQGTLPLTIGGGIGQSRLCMFLLSKVHIGEVQASVWPEDLLATCERQGIPLL